MNETIRQAARSALVLAAFAVAGSAILAAANRATAEQIAANELAVLEGQLSALLPAGEYDNDLLADTIEVELPSTLSPDLTETVYRARRAGQPVAAILPVTAPNGYTGAIRMLVGIRHNGSIAAVRVVKHRETPGLGDGIDIQRSDWIRQFDGRSLRHPNPERWKVRKDNGDFDQLTGATITPRAVVGAVRAALEYYRQHRDMLYAEDGHGQQ